MTTACRDISKLKAPFRDKVENFLAECRRKGFDIFLTETWRSEERQKELISRGLSKIKRSLHQEGLAVDIAFKGTLYPTDMNIWNAVYDIAEKYGIDCGYRLWKWDLPHLQDNANKLIKNNMNQKEILELQIKQNSELWHKLEEMQSELQEMNTKNREVLANLK